MPVKHPDPFNYTTDGLTDSVNPYVALLRDGSADGNLPLVFGAALATYPGQWAARVAAYHGRKGPYQQVIIEVGCHLGHTLLTMAAAYPDTLFIGIDVTFKRVVTTAQRSQKRGLKNVFCLLANATALAQLFQPNELDGAIIFFPDPWVKKARQTKNRLIDATFCLNLATVLREGGFGWLKTDQQGYFDAAAGFLSAAGFGPAAATSGFLGDEFTSTFEQRFRRQNLPTFAGKWVKVGDDRGHFA